VYCCTPMDDVLAAVEIYKVMTMFLMLLGT
jgi:hypothetical protein